MIYFGYGPEFRALGWWAGYCPCCEASRPFRVFDVLRVNHIYGFSLGDGMWVDRLVRCDVCYGVIHIGADDGVHITDDWDRSQDFASLASTTNPGLHPSLIIDASSPGTSFALLRRCYLTPTSRRMDTPDVQSLRENTLVLIVVLFVTSTLFIVLPPSTFTAEIAPGQVLIGMLYFVGGVIAAALAAAYLTDRRERHEIEDALRQVASEYGIGRRTFEQLLDRGAFTPNATLVLLIASPG